MKNVNFENIPEVRIFNISLQKKFNSIPKLLVTYYQNFEKIDCNFLEKLVKKQKQLQFHYRPEVLHNFNFKKILVAWFFEIIISNKILKLKNNPKNVLLKKTQEGQLF